MESDQRTVKKWRQYFIVLLCLAVVSSIGFKNNGIISTIETTSEVYTTTEVGNITVISAVTKLKRGDIGHITIQGEAGVRYTLTTTFTTGSTTRRVTQWRVADSSGRAIFTWTVGNDTALGTHPINISGGGKVLKLYHTVIQ